MSAQDDLIYDSCQKTSSKDSVERTRNFIKTMVYGTTEKYDFMDKEKNKVMKKPPGQESKSKLSKRGHQAQKAAAKKERMNKNKSGQQESLSNTANEGDTEEATPLEPEIKNDTVEKDNNVDAEKTKGTLQDNSERKKGPMIVVASSTEQDQDDDGGWQVVKQRKKK